MSARIDPFAALHSVLARIGALLMWTHFVIFHIILIVAFLLYAWATKIDPAWISAQIKAVYLQWHLTTFVAIPAAFGVSIPLVLACYIWAWRRVYRALVLPYIFKDIQEAVRGLREGRVR